MPCPETSSHDRIQSLIRYLVNGKAESSSLLLCCRSSFGRVLDVSYKTGIAQVLPLELKGGDQRTPSDISCYVQSSDQGRHAMVPHRAIISLHASTLATIEDATACPNVTTLPPAYLATISSCLSDDESEAFPADGGGSVHPPQSQRLELDKKSWYLDGPHKTVLRLHLMRSLAYQTGVLDSSRTQKMAQKVVEEGLAAAILPMATVELSGILSQLVDPSHSPHAVARLAEILSGDRVSLQVMERCLRWLDRCCLHHRLTEGQLWWKHCCEGLPEGITLEGIGGEVSIEGFRVKAISHFPSVGLGGVALGSQAQGGRGGRWYYEVVLITDGLMQIGWADQAFRCDPVCGQGVGGRSGEASPPFVANTTF